MRPPAATTLVVLELFGVVNLARGAIHAFAPDGGLESIGGFDISGARQTILFFIGAVGAGQMATGLLDLWVALRARSFATTLLAFETLRTLIGIGVAQAVKTAPNDYPGERFALVVLAVLAVALLLEWTRPFGRPRAA